MAIRLIFAFLFGLIAHQFKRITDKMPRGWQNLTDHAFGYSTVFFFVILIWRHINRDDEFTRQRVETEILAAGALAGLAYGMGNALAWVMGAIMGQE